MSRRGAHAPSTRGLVVGATIVVAATVGLVIYAVGRDGSDRPDTAAIGVGSVVMLGDSITAGGDWPALLPGVDVVNAGRPGFTTEQLVPVAADVAARRPQLVFVLTGTNDIRDGHPPSWTTGHLAALLDRLAASPDTEVVVQTVLPRADRPDAVVAINDAIVALADERDLELLDLHPSFDGGGGGLRPAETTDGLHLSPAGYERWAGVLREELAARG